MTPEGLRMLEHEIDMAVREACGIVRAEARVHGTEAVRAKYALDDWEYALALKGELPAECALRVLNYANRADREARALMNSEVERRR